MTCKECGDGSGARPGAAGLWRQSDIKEGESFFRQRLPAPAASDRACAMATNLERPCDMLTYSPPAVATSCQAPPPPLHILHGVLSLDLGGLERLVVDLVRAGRSCHARSSVMCIERPGTLAGAVEEAGGEVLCLHK